MLKKSQPLTVTDLDLVQTSRASYPSGGPCTCMYQLYRIESTSFKLSRAGLKPSAAEAMTLPII